ncbi:MAG TPA: flagellar type III secretion system protein FlhB [Lautropia sp.]|jgi:flagellar biosynthetic protein FlhB|nr:flagellar type III secretion system protein FlhB [Lautropia sp.]
MADSEASKEDKQLPASEQRLKQAATEGNVARSRDAGHVIVLGTGVGILAMAGAGMRTDLVDLLKASLRFDQAARGDTWEILRQMSVPMYHASGLLLMVLMTTVVGALAASVIPGGMNFAPEALGFKASRLSPMAGIKRIFSLRGFVEFVKLAGLAIALGLIGVWFVSASIAEFASLSLGFLPSSISSAADLVVGGFTLLLLLLVAVAVFDVPFQWFRHRADLRMTREEGRKENRESEGDPMMRGQVRARQREMSKRRMLAAVPSADIIVVNPTHYAVAIRYDESNMDAPLVVAKGVDILAARIQAIARESNVPVLQAAPLARALYANVEINQEVPRALYAAIAQVLAYVYQLKRWVPGRTAAPKEPTDIEVPAGMDPSSTGEANGR